MTDNRTRAEYFPLIFTDLVPFGEPYRKRVREGIEILLNEAEARGWNAAKAEIESLKAQYKAQSAAFKAREADYNRAEKNLVKERQRLSAERIRSEKLMEALVDQQSGTEK